MNDIDLELLKKFLKNQTNEFETNIVTNWLLDNNLSTNDLVTISENPERIKLFEQINAQKDWLITRERIQHNKKVIPLKYLLRAAASIAIILTISALVMQVYKITNRSFVVSNYCDGVLNVMLPDSSQVSLNRNSKLIYKNNFISKREVTIDGNVFFEVKRNVHSPFTINTAESSIKVLGTSFSVTTERQNTSVVVASGKVAFFSTKRKCDTLFLTKGDKGIYINNNKCLQKVINEDQNYLSWKNHNLKFNNTPLRKVFSDLEKYFNIKISVVNPSINNLQYTSEFKNPSLSDVLKEMELVLNIQSKRIARNIIIDVK